MARISETQLRAIIRSELIKEMRQNNVDESKMRKSAIAALGAGALALGAADVADTAYGIKHSYEMPEADLASEYVSVYNDMNYFEKEKLIKQINKNIVSFGFDARLQFGREIVTDDVDRRVIEIIQQHPDKFRITRMPMRGIGPALVVNWNAI
jgi:hypothetical protein